MAEFHDGLVGTGIERVEVLPLFLLHAIDRVPCDAFHTGLEVAANENRKPILVIILIVFEK